MRSVHKFTVLFFLASLLLAACASPAATSAPEATSTDSTPPTSTVSPEPSLTPTPAIEDLEILEWYEHVVANRVDPANTDTVVEVLIHNPNNFPVRVLRDAVEVRFVNAAGETVASANPFFYYIWQGEWMTPNQTAAFSTGACFYSCGVETQEWETLELTASLEVATGPAYTEDVEFTAEFVLLEEVLHGYEGPGVATTLANTSDQVLESIATLVFAYDASGRFVGTASFGNAVASFTEDIGLQPGDSASGFEVSEINYLGNERLTYEAQAIGIIAVGAPTAEPLGEPAAEWQGVPIMPGAISGGEVTDGYEFTTQATVDEITQFYEAAIAELGYSLTTSGEQGGVTFMLFEKGSSQAVIAIYPEGDVNRVQIAATP